MSVNVRYRTLDGDKVGERVAEVDHVERLLQILDTEAPFGITVTPSAGSVEHEVVVGTQGGLGALYYTDEDGSWYSRGETPEGDGPVFAEVDFPSYFEIPLERLEQALLEFMAASSWPICVEWQQDPYSSAVSG
jgi:hypothetical protein